MKKQQARGEQGQAGGLGGGGGRAEGLSKRRSGQGRCRRQASKQSLPTIVLRATNNGNERAASPIMATRPLFERNPLPPSLNSPTSARPDAAPVPRRPHFAVAFPMPPRPRATHCITIPRTTPCVASFPALPQLTRLHSKKRNPRDLPLPPRQTLLPKNLPPPHSFAWPSPAGLERQARTTPLQ